MSIQPRLADHLDGYYRHSEDEGILIIDGSGPNYLEIFRAAVQTPYEDCRAVTIELPDDKIAEDKAAYAQLGMQFTQSSESYLYGDYFEEVSDESRLDKVHNQLLEQAKLRREFIDADEKDIMLWLMGKFRLDPDRPHQPHDFSVLNRVFFTAGTVLHSNQGFVRPREGDYLYMKERCPHEPEVLTQLNTSQPRLTVIAL